MEEKLAAYRARKAKEKESEGSLFNRLKRSFSSSEKKPDCGQDEQRKDSHPSQKPAVTESYEQCDETATVESPKSSSLQWLLVALKFLLWLCVWGIFVELQFGAVYFTFSLILFVYFNTRSEKKDSNMSAYSVFNKNCERIQGTLTAEQMQRDMFRVPGLPG